MNQRQNQFLHYLGNTLSELEYRLNEILTLCNRSTEQYRNGNSELKGQELNFAFSAFSGQLQTIKDVLPVISGNEISWAMLGEVKHAKFIKGCRNAITHDGQQVINMWIEGKYYVACDFYRVTSKGGEIIIAPSEDIATICIEFTLGLIDLVKQCLDSLVYDLSESQPLYNVRFYDAAIRHPAIGDSVRKMYVDADKSNLEQPVDLTTELNSKIDKLRLICTSILT
ncbi:hypothetical protein [Vibrio cholerae]|uniref:hypothetical protein n=1 Tax=Vibrio cholerae TaxID=666 RepID=UPI001159F1E9|nr:hypothetical protein [Vibrio cholerae]TQP01929.1 hypothetical protein FLL97_09515 [Vibrio cholerae]TQP83054.1 hypothetical protein FLL74_17810 [Vibrio cholerae]